MNTQSDNTEYNQVKELMARITQQRPMLPVQIMQLYLATLPFHTEMKTLAESIGEERCISIAKQIVMELNK